jgi:hypothetical protein
VFSHIDPTISSGWREMIGMWLDVPIQCVAFVSIAFAALSHANGKRTNVRDVLRTPWQRVPVAMLAFLLLQSVTFWPSPLLSWSYESEYGILLDYSILTINVLTCDVLAFVFLPVLLAENYSLIGTFRRSAQLVVRHVWRILAIDMAMWGVFLILNSVMSGVYYRIGIPWADLAWSAMTAGWILVMLSLNCCISVAAYHLLRHEREGPAPAALARVFD